MKRFLLSILSLVTCMNLMATDYELVTNASALETGAKYILVGKKSDTDFYAMGAQNTNNRQAVAVTENNGMVSITDETVFPVTLLASGNEDFPYLLSTAEGTVLYAASTGKNYLKETKDLTMQAAQASIVIEDGSVATIKFCNTDNTSLRNCLQFNTSNTIFSCYGSTSGQADVYLYKEKALTPDEVSMPVISPRSGNFIDGESVNVSMTCSTEGATIHYTLDGTTPTAESTVYAEPFDVTATTTVQAIAVKDDVLSNVSSATYTFFTPVSSIEEMYEKVPLPEGNNATSELFVVGFEPVVAYANGSNVYVTEDGSQFAYIYKSNTGLTKGNVINGKWFAKVQNYYGTYEIVPQETLTAQEGFVEVPDLKEVEDLGALNLEAHSNHVVRLKHIVFTEDTPASDAASADRNFQVEQNGTAYHFRNQFKTPSMPAGTYDLTAVVALYNDELTYYVTEDFMEYAPLPVFSASDSTVFLSGATVEISCPLEEATIQYSVDGGENWNTYAEPIVISRNTTLMAYVEAEGYVNSPAATVHFLAQAARPEFSLASGEVKRGTTFEITCATEGLDIVYALYQDEADLATVKPVLYDGPVTIEQDTKVYAAAGVLKTDNPESLSEEIWDAEAILFSDSTAEYTIAPYAVPEKLYLVGCVNEGTWENLEKVEMTRNEQVFTATASITETGTFAIVECLEEDPETLTYYGGTLSEEQDINLEETTELAPQYGKLKLPAGNYEFTVTFNAFTITLDVVEKIVDAIEAASAEGVQAEYYNLQGIRVKTPVSGNIYIKRQGDAVIKVRIR